jgi:hypothetical protein
MPNAKIWSRRAAPWGFILVLAVMLIGATPPIARGAAAAAEPHASQQALQLEKAHDSAGITAALKKASTPADKALFRAAAIYVRWNKVKNNPGKQTQLGRQFIQDVSTYLKAGGTSVDAAWAEQQAEFILANLTSNAVNQIEFWSGTPDLRAELSPPANLARRLLEISLKHFAGVVAKLNNATKFTHADEVRYTNAMNGQRDAGYFLAYADYFSGLAAAPTSAERQTFLTAAIKNISPYARSASNGVYDRALLLSGKALLHNGQYNKAIRELTKAQTAQAPVWLQYDARYQHVTALLRSGKYGQAQAQLKSFMAWTAQQAGADSVSAKMGEQLLAFRIAMASAKTLKNPVKRAASEAAAIQIVSDVITKAPQYQGLIFSHLAQNLPARINAAKLQPLQELAVAWLDAQNPASANQRRSLATAKNLLMRKHLPPSIRAEATLIAAITAAQLGDIDLAARMNVAFVRMAPTDPRAKHAIGMALSELARLNQSRQVPAGTDKLTTEAISLDWRHFHDPQIRFPYALQLENAGQYPQAIKLFTQIPASDSLYLDAQYQLVRIGAEELSAMGAKKVPALQQRQAARKLLAVASGYLKLLDHPPASVGKKTLARAQAYRANILLLEAGTAIDPLHNPYRAGQFLDKLSAMDGKLSPKLRGILLRYRIRQYQLAGENNKILPLVQKFASQSTQNSTDVIKGLIGQYDQESRKVRNTNPGKAQRLAANAAELLRELITSLQSQPGKKNADDIYAYQQILAGELSRAGQGEAAWQLFKKLEKQRPADLTNFIGAARALYAAGHFSHAHSIYVRLIPQLEPGSEIYWQAYYYLIRCNSQAHAYEDQTRAALKQLVALYGSAIGGKEYHHRFELLLHEFNLTD